MDARAATLRIRERLRLTIYLSERTQREVEERIGFSRGYLSQLLGGTVEIKLWHLLAILRTIEVEPADFFADLSPRRRHPTLQYLDEYRRGPRARENHPLSLDLARLYGLGIESLVDFRDRLERCEDALVELERMGVLDPSDGR